MKIVLYLIFFCHLVVAERYLTKEQALKLAFPNADTIEEKKVIVTNNKKKEIEAKGRRIHVSRLFKYFQATKNGEILGYAVIDEVLGKHLPITYMVAVDLECRVQQVEILVYREAYGWEIRQRKFRSQFKNKDIKSKVRLNTNIRNISGATISCRNITNGIHNVLAHLSVLLPKNVALKKEPPPPLPVSLKKFKRSQLLMGTLLDITLYAKNSQKAERGFTLAFAEVSRLEKIFSTYQKESEISRLNQVAFYSPQVLSPDAFTLILTSQQFFEKTEGAFDLTVYPLVALWKKAHKENQLPTKIEVSQKKQQIGMQHLQIDFATRKFKFLQSGMSLDFGGIGKGYALDQAGLVLKRNGLNRALLNFGGNILVLGPPPDRSFWKIAVKHPTRKTFSSLRLSKGSVSTSANYERGFLIQNKRYSHLINPKTGFPHEGILSTTVIADSATEADALSTACFILGPEKTKTLIQQDKTLGGFMITSQGQEHRFGIFSRLEVK